MADEDDWKDCGQPVTNGGSAAEAYLNPAGGLEEWYRRYGQRFSYQTTTLPPNAEVRKAGFPVPRCTRCFSASAGSEHACPVKIEVRYAYVAKDGTLWCSYCGASWTETPCCAMRKIPTGTVRLGASPRELIRSRIAALDDIHATYLAYLRKRIEERDWHGGWDACVNLSETEQEQHGLRQALEALGEKP